MSIFELGIFGFSSVHERVKDDDVVMNPDQITMAKIFSFLKGPENMSVIVRLYA